MNGHDTASLNARNEVPPDAGVTGRNTCDEHLAPHKSNRGIFTLSAIATALVNSSWQIDYVLTILPTRTGESRSETKALFELRLQVADLKETIISQWMGQGCGRDIDLARALVPRMIPSSLESYTFLMVIVL